MKKLLLFAILIFWGGITIVSAQTSTMTFETSSGGSTSFINNGYTFNIVSQAGTFRIQSNYPNTGWNGTANDNVYIDNTGTTNINSPSFSVKSNSVFTVSKFWVFLSNTALNQTALSGTLIITGKLGGVTQFTTTKTSGFNTTFNATTGTTGVNNGFTLIDLATLNGQNNSNAVIDEIQLQSTGNYVYMCLDAFTWSKYTGPIPIMPDVNGVLYVKKGSTGIGNSWSSAVGELADALKAAKTNTDIKEIWVAGGTYQPMYSPADNNFGNADGRNNAFLLVKDVKVYGGFAGTETALAQRDLSIVANKTTLSGDYNDNDVLTGYGNALNISNNSENARQVLISVGDIGTAVLDGFTIKGGNADGGNLPAINAQTILVSSWGGGLYVYNSPTLALNYIQFVGNKASTGGAMAVGGSNAAPKIENVAFTQNYATQAGGALYSAQSLSLVSTLFLGNKSESIAGALLKAGGGMFLVDRCFFAGNSSAGDGGAIYDQTGVGNTYINTVFSANQSGNKGGALFIGNIFNTRTNSFINCTFSGNTATQGSATVEWTSATTSYTHQMEIINSIVNDGENAIGAGGQVKAYLKNTLLKQSSAPLANIIMQGNSTSLLNLNPSFTDTNGADNVLGTADDDLTLTNSPAIGAGDNSLYAGNINTDKDLAGNPRLVGNNIDLGPYESAIQPQTITAANLSRTYGDADFEPGATASSGLAVSYASADNSTAEAYQDVNDGNKWKLKIKKVGTINVTASQAGGNGYAAAPDKVFVLTIQPKALTVTATGNDKIYDATTNAAVNLNSNALAGDVVTLAHTSATFGDDNVGNNKTITVNGITLSGTSAANYTFNTTASATANITPFALTVSATGNNRVYDATNNATVDLSSNAFAGDNLTLAYTSATFSDKAVANGKTVSVSGISLSGTDAGNYTFNTTASTTANITPFALTVSATANNRVYDATNNATVNLSSNAFTGDNLTLAYTSATFGDDNVGNNKTITINGISLSGTDAGNYTFNTTASATANITPFALTVSATANNRVYNATNNATVDLSSNAFAGDNLTLAYSSATFSDKAVANGKTVSVSGISLSGTDAGNYTFNTTASATANITPFALTVSATGNNRVYDATNNATVDLSSNAFAGDNLTLAYTSATFSDKAVANGKAVSVSGISLSGTDAGNYTFNTTASTTANITPFALTVLATGNNRVYDATNNATVDLSSNAFAGDMVTLAYTSAAFNDKSVANGKAVSVSGISLSGTDAGNYTFNTTASTMANITPFALTISASASNKVYNGNTDATVALTHNGLAGDILTVNHATASFDNRNVGNGKTVSISGISLSGTDAGNYTFGTTASATAAITPATLSIVAQARAKTYGDADPVLTYAPTGLIGADAIVGSLARTSGENVGTYAITQGTLSAGPNYVVSFTGASLAINRATLTVTAANAARCYGQANPSFSLNYNGFRFSDNENSLATRPQATTTANASSASGSYPIAVSGGSSANYTLVYANGSLRVDALPNVSIVPSRQGTIGRGLTLQLVASGGNSYSWASADGIISGQNGATLTIRPTANTTYTVTVANGNGCSSTASYAVAVEDDLSILKATNLLSPNGDGVNDVWKVDNMDMYPRAVVRIFDKAGRVVYTRKGYDNTWDGTYNGQPLAENTYYYIIDLEAGKVLRGYITLVRDR